MRNKRGFTLIELLIVIAIIGILAALLIPNAISAVQKAKQKGTMKDINVIAAAITHYITDKGVAPSSNNGAMTETSDALSSAIVPFYLKAIPYQDQWGSPFYVYTGTDTNSVWLSDVDDSEVGLDDFAVGSYGRDGSAGGQDFTYDPATASQGFFEITGMESFKNDLVNWNGNWVSAPRTKNQ